jgi:hypothetical protein
VTLKVTVWPDLAYTTPADVVYVPVPPDTLTPLVLAAFAPGATAMKPAMLARLAIAATQRCPARRVDAARRRVEMLIGVLLTMARRPVPGLRAKLGRFQERLDGLRVQLSKQGPPGRLNL